MRVHELIAKLQALPNQNLPVSAWTAGNDYGTPQVVVIVKNGRKIRVVIGTKEDE